MERNERLEAADKCASRYTNENEARIARRAFMLGCEFEAQGEIIKGAILDVPQPHWKPTEEQMRALGDYIDGEKISSYDIEEIVSLYNNLRNL